MPMIPNNYVLVENTALIRLGLDELIHVGNKVFSEGLYVFLEPAAVLVDISQPRYGKYRRYVVFGPNTIAVKYSDDLAETFDKVCIRYYIINKPVWVKACKIHNTSRFIYFLYNTLCKCIYREDDYKIEYDQDIKVLCTKSGTVISNSTRGYSKALTIYREQIEGIVAFVKPFHLVLYGASTFLDTYLSEAINLATKSYLSPGQTSYDILAYVFNNNELRPFILINEKNHHIIINGVPTCVSDEFMKIIIYNSLLYLFCF